MTVLKSRSGSLAILALCFFFALIPIAEAKFVPLEVQITSSGKSVRVSPKDFYTRINVPSAAQWFGVFEYLAGSPPGPVSDQPLTVSLFILSSRTHPSSVLSVDGPDAIRETIVRFNYYQTSTEAIGRIIP